MEQQQVSAVVTTATATSQLFLAASASAAAAMRFAVSSVSMRLEGNCWAAPIMLEATSSAATQTFVGPICANGNTIAA